MLVVSQRETYEALRWPKLVKSLKCPPGGDRDEFAWLTWLDRCLAGPEGPRCWQRKKGL